MNLIMRWYGIWGNNWPSVKLIKARNLIFEAENSLCADNGMHPFVSGQFWEFIADRLTVKAKIQGYDILLHSTPCYRNSSRMQKMQGQKGWSFFTTRTVMELTNSSAKVLPNIRCDFVLRSFNYSRESLFLLGYVLASLTWDLQTPANSYHLSSVVDAFNILLHS